MLRSEKKTMLRYVQHVCDVTVALETCLICDVVSLRQRSSLARQARSTVAPITTLHSF